MDMDRVPCKLCAFSGETIRLKKENKIYCKVTEKWYNADVECICVSFKRYDN